MKLKLTLTLLAFLILSGCKSPDEKVRSEKIEAKKEISAAEANVKKTEEKEAMKVQNAAPVDKAEKKVEATENIADANRKVDNAKIDATKEITAAEQKAGAGGTYTK